MDEFQLMIYLTGTTTNGHCSYSTNEHVISMIMEMLSFAIERFVHVNRQLLFEARSNINKTISLRYHRATDLRINLAHLFDFSRRFCCLREKHSIRIILETTSTTSSRSSTKSKRSTVDRCRSTSVRRF
jgi:hypothetical protein